MQRVLQKRNVKDKQIQLKSGATRELACKIDIIGLTVQLEWISLYIWWLWWGNTNGAYWWGLVSHCTFLQFISISSNSK